MTTISQILPVTVKKAPSTLKKPFIPFVLLPFPVPLIFLYLDYYTQWSFCCGVDILLFSGFINISCLILRDLYRWNGQREQQQKLKKFSDLTKIFRSAWHGTVCRTTIGQVKTTDYFGRWGYHRDWDFYPEDCCRGTVETRLDGQQAASWRRSLMQLICPVMLKLERCMVHIGHGFIQKLYGSVIVQAVTGLFLLQRTYRSKSPAKKCQEVIWKKLIFYNSAKNGNLNRPFRYIGLAAN